MRERKSIKGTCTRVAMSSFRRKADGIPPTRELAVRRDQLAKKRKQMSTFENPSDDVEKDQSLQAKL